MLQIKTGKSSPSFTPASSKYNGFHVLPALLISPPSKMFPISVTFLLKFGCYLPFDSLTLSTIFCSYPRLAPPFNCLSQLLHPLGQAIDPFFSQGQCLSLGRTLRPGPVLPLFVVLEALPSRVNFLLVNLVLVGPEQAFGSTTGPT